MTHRLPISVKGIIFEDDAVWLRRNERHEWELPGGKMDPGEQPTETVVRELQEEIGLRCEVVELIDAVVYTIVQSPDEDTGVLVLSYLCRVLERTGGLELMGEAGKAEFRLTALRELTSLPVPNFYLRAIADAHRRFVGR